MNDGKLHLISEKYTKGAVYTLKTLHGYLLAGINSRIQLYTWKTNSDTKELVPICSHAGHIVACFMDTAGDDLILVGTPWLNDKEVRSCACV